LPEFLTTNSLIYYTENIIKEAQEELYLLFPYLQLSREFYETLKESSDRGIHIIIVYANEDLHTEEKLKLSEIENLEIYQNESLNAKCCCSDSNILIGSMDLHQLTLSDSLEMGIFANKLDDADLYKKIYNEIKSIISSSKNMNLHKRAVEELIQPAVEVKKIYHGVCIQCAMPISYNLEKPYCRSCAPKNAAVENEICTANYCHLCGTIQENNRDSILCETCQAEV
jgi:hypothetical protein